jgi:hypothetical protein
MVATRSRRRRASRRHRAPTRRRASRRVRAPTRRRATRHRISQTGGFVPYASQQFGSNMVDSEEAGGAVVIRNVSGVPTPMSASKYRREYRGEYDDAI